MLLGMDRREMLKELKPVFTPAVLQETQAAVRNIHTSSALLDYLQDLIDASRQRHSSGLSPRAGIALLRASQSWALMHGRDMVLPEDVQAVAVNVIAHRLGSFAGGVEDTGLSMTEKIIRAVPVR